MAEDASYDEAPLALGASAQMDQGEAYLCLVTKFETVAVRVDSLDYAARLARAINQVPRKENPRDQTH